MGNCLVTTLKATVSDNTLPKLDEFIVKVKSYNNDECNLTTQMLSWYGYCKQIEIVGNGYFLTNAPENGNWSDGTESIGKVINLADSTNNKYYCSNGDYIIKFSPKYEGTYITFECGKHLSYNLEDLRFAAPRLVALSAHGKECTGHILPFLKNKTADQSIQFDIRWSSLDFSLKELLDPSIICDVTRLWVSETDIKDRDAATVNAIKQKYPDIDYVD